MNEKPRNTLKIAKAIAIVLFNLTLLVLVVLLYMYLIEQEETIHLPRQIVLPSVIILSLMVLIFFAAIMVRLLKKPIQLFAGNKSILGGNLSSRLLSFGIIVFLFPKAILDFFIRLLHLIKDLIADLPTVLFNLWFKTPEFKEKSGFLIEEALNWFFTCLVKIVNFLMDALLAFFNNLPIRSLFLALILWIILGNLISPLSVEKEKELDTSPFLKYFRRLGNYLSNMKMATRQNISLSLILMVSIYLMIVAIVSIPWLQETDASELLTKENLQERMEETMLSKSEFDSLYRENYLEKENPLTVLDPILKITADSLAILASPHQLPVDYKNKWENRRDKIGNAVEDINVNRRYLNEQWIKYRQENWNQLSDLQKSAIDDFEATTLSPMSVQEKATYFKEISNWFRSTNSRQQKDLATWVRYIDREEEAIKNGAVWQARAIEEDVLDFKQYVNSVDSIEQNELPYIYLGDILNPRNPFNRYNFPRVSTIEKSLPAPPEPGLGWGPFGYVARWLLRTKSLALALITGMLGFGLFGATISSFIREKAARKPGEPIVKNLADVIIRGVSAAIVVFLGVKGGLAIFTIGENEPNPYALFFTCLVGAVFSEDVWGWARERINQDLSGEQAEKLEANTDT